jgi:tRNA(fMet)-specific endonuclease VapC
VSALVVDTSAWVDYFAGAEVAGLEDALADGRVYLPVIVVAELLSARLSPRRHAQLYDFLADLPLCDASFEHWVRVGRLRTTLAARGLTISTPDAHVAQSALDLDGSLLTHDRIFSRVAPHIRLRLA